MYSGANLGSRKLKSRSLEVEYRGFRQLGCCRSAIVSPSMKPPRGLAGIAIRWKWAASRSTRGSSSTTKRPIRIFGAPRSSRCRDQAHKYDFRRFARRWPPGIFWNGPRWPFCAAEKCRSFKCWGMLRDLVRFYREAPLEAEEMGDISLNATSTRAGTGRGFGKIISTRWPPLSGRRRQRRSGTIPPGPRPLLREPRSL